jgi:hypothetical protein
MEPSRPLNGACDACAGPPPPPNPNRWTPGISAPSILMQIQKHTTCLANTATGGLTKTHGHLGETTSNP